MLNVVMALYREARTMQCYGRSYLATNKGDYIETYLGGVTMAASGCGFNRSMQHIG